MGLLSTSKNSQMKSSAIKKFPKPDEEEIVYTEQDNEEVEEQSKNPDEETIQEEQVADSENESENEDLLIPLSYKVLNLENDTYTGTIQIFSESTYKNGKTCWYVEIEVENPNVIFYTSVPHELNAYQGLGMAVSQLQKPCVRNLIGRRIRFTIENHETSNKVFSNIIASKLLKKK